MRVIVGESYFISSLPSSNRIASCSCGLIEIRPFGVPRPCTDRRSTIRRTCLLMMILMAKKRLVAETPETRASLAETAGRLSQQPSSDPFYAPRSCPCLANDAERGTRTPSDPRVRRRRDCTCQFSSSSTDCCKDPFY